jgi:hypothetical protein
MPKIYEYFGLIIFFYSNEHDPIHVHAKYGDREGRVEFLVENGLVVKVVFKNVKGKKPLKQKQKRLFVNFSKALSDEIIETWINYFVLHRKVVFKKVMEKI